MFPDILDENQHQLLPTIKKFSRKFYLVGGTAISLQIGHRRSIDFDLFTDKPINKLNIKSYFLNPYTIQKIIWEDKNQLHLIVNNVKITFFQYPFAINATIDFRKIIKIPSLLDLAVSPILNPFQKMSWF